MEIKKENITLSEVNDNLNEAKKVKEDTRKMIKNVAGEFLTEEDITEIMEEEKILNNKLKEIKVDDIKDMSIKEIEKILGDKIVSGINSKIGSKLNVNLNDFKRDFLKFLKSENDISNTVDNFSENVEKLQNDYLKEINELFKSNSVINIKERIEKELQKEDLKPDVAKGYNIILNAINESEELNIIKSKIKSKGGKQIIKECNKNYDKEFKKFIKILKNSKRKFFNPEKIELALLEVYKNTENEKYIKPFLYVVYRILTRKKNDTRIQTQDSLFINYFIVNVIYAENRVKSGEDTFINNVNECIKLFK